MGGDAGADVDCDACNLVADDFTLSGVQARAKLAELGNARWRELVERHHALVRVQLSRFRGREIDTAGDGFFAAFDGPIRAIRCAQAVRQAIHDLGLEIRAGLHTGECEVIGDKITGIRS